MRTFFRLLLVFTFLGFAIPVHAQYFPQSGIEVLRQRALDTKSRLNVLSIALQPGYEDLAGLAYYRMAMGARIVSAYVTNGEAGESDVRGEYPNQLAAARRTEAAAVMAFLGGEEYFLNVPDIGAVKDTSVVRDFWHPDTLRPRLLKLISDLKPDVILLARNWATEGESPEGLVLRDLLLRTLRRLEPRSSKNRDGARDEFTGWTVAGVLLESGSEKGVRIPVDEIHPLWKKSYQEIADEAGALYRSCSAQRNLWYGAGSARSLITYESVYPRTQRLLKRFDEGLPRPIPGKLAGLDRKISALTRTLVGGNPTPAHREEARRSVAALLDSVDHFLSQPLTLNSLGRKIAMQWKLTLEQLRVSILGVEVRYTLEPTILTGRQLAFLKIDTVMGLQPKDSVWMYFPPSDQRWTIDESTELMVALRYDSPYRLLSPAALDYHLPAGMEGLSQTSVGRTFVFFLMCRAKNQERNFIFRGSVRLLYSPRFTKEVLTPIVFAVPNEQVIVRLTNHSRDGVRDSVYVDDSLAVAPKKEFRINFKDQAEIDTLVLQWKRPLQEGTYLIPVSIGGQEVTRFAARAFEARIDTGRSIALLSGVTGTPTALSLRRLGANWTEIHDVQGLAAKLAPHRMAIVDRRALTLMKGLTAQIRILRDFVERGGHLLVLAQDAAVWNRAPIIDNFRLSTSNAWGEAEEVRPDSTHRLFAGPNRINTSDWEEWFYRRSYNTLSGTALASARIVLSSADGKSPMVAEWTMGNGTLTYVDLALHYQLLNIHPGAFRLLANLISY
ncbi:MAG: hypothetical protein HW389_2981 [Bacteroidetes bacterium]|nr:hypothetical protein [Bacteroidota bacterium]